MKTAELYTKRDIIIIAIAVMAVLYHFAYIAFTMFGPTQHQIIHLGLVLILVCLALPKGKKKPNILQLPTLIVAAICIIYVWINYEDLEIRAGHPIPLDEVVGWLLIAAVLSTTWMSFGWVLPILSLVGIVYMFVAPYMPGSLQGPELSSSKIISYLVIGFRGIFDVLLDVSAKEIFPFIIFGSFLIITGAHIFFNEVGKIVARRFVGGSALNCVVSSGLLGMITGTPAANVAVTGTFTIPSMKADGRSPEEAAGFEACAATGGTVMPPVMGATAFIMAGVMGIAYAHICYIAIIPAVLYYLLLLFSAQVTGKKLRLKPSSEGVNWHNLAIYSPTFLLPICLLTIFLISGISAIYAVLWTSIVLILVSFIQKKTRPTVKKFISACKDGAMMAARIGVACACIGMLASALQVTQLAMRLPDIIEALSFGNLFISLVWAAIVGIILGCGMPGMAVYIILVIVAVPILENLGVEKEASHMFMLYYAVFSAITPPVALATIVAAKVAEADFWGAGWQGVKIGIVGLSIPFIFVYRPELLLVPGTTLGSVTLAFTVVVITYILAVALLNNFLLQRLSLIEMVISGISVATLLVYLFWQNHLALIVGLSGACIIFIWQGVVEKRRRIEAVKA
ncbi:MAG: TRAP transporter fused permease subunit [Syntrophorhabdaceae bacterium]|nr:TRAP transporter fused permease subunit [Syntrophorhabdaceae bacterium]MDD5242542.1 TRAP transporter fused permease subunit [Syntrophorhabdaceae bacterium]